jgi:hypothetical protein
MRRCDLVWGGLRACLPLRPAFSSRHASAWDLPLYLRCPRGARGSISDQALEPAAAAAPERSEGERDYSTSAMGEGFRIDLLSTSTRSVLDGIPRSQLRRHCRKGLLQGGGIDAGGRCLLPRRRVRRGLLQGESSGARTGQGIASRPPPCTLRSAWRRPPPCNPCLPHGPFPISPGPPAAPPQPPEQPAARAGAVRLSEGHMQDVCRNARSSLHLFMRAWVHH